MESIDTILKYWVAESWDLCCNRIKIVTEYQRVKTRKEDTSQRNLQDMVEAYTDPVTTWISSRVDANATCYDSLSQADTLDIHANLSARTQKVWKRIIITYLQRVYKMH